MYTYINYSLDTLRVKQGNVRLSYTIFLIYSHYHSHSLTLSHYHFLSPTLPSSQSPTLSLSHTPTLSLSLTLSLSHALSQTLTLQQYCILENRDIVYTQYAISILHIQYTNIYCICYLYRAHCSMLLQSHCQREIKSILITSALLNPFYWLEPGPTTCIKAFVSQVSIITIEVDVLTSHYLC